jgi:hypothetical protein
MRRVLALVAAALVALPAAAQSWGPMPPRPNLPRGADPNDWEAYFDLAVSLEPRAADRAEAAFTWAARLDPSRSEPITRSGRRSTFATSGASRSTRMD